MPMPVASSGVILGEYNVPNGVGIAKPPAKGTPPCLLWQATQSPTWARYSPRLIGASIAGTSDQQRCAAQAAATAIVMTANPNTKPLIRGPFVSWFTAAGQW